MSLYDDLISIERTPEVYESLLEKCGNDLKKLEEIMGFELAPVAQTISPDYIARAQRKTFNRRNNVLIPAVMGVQSVENVVQELSEVNQGIRKYLPRLRVDHDHNETLRYASELVGGMSHLKSKHIYVLDNSVSLGLLAGAGLLAVGYAWVNFTTGDPALGYDPEALQKSVELMNHVIEGFAAFGAIMAGIICAHSVDEMFDIAKALVTLPKPRGRRVVVLSEGGGDNAACGSHPQLYIDAVCFPGGIAGAFWRRAGSPFSVAFDKFRFPTSDKGLLFR